jgi:hypothetical protein
MAKPLFQTRHYREIVRILRENGIVWNGVIMAFCSAFAKDNPLFDPERFKDDITKKHTKA